MNKPTSYEQFQKRIHEKLSVLTEKEKMIAGYILDNHQEIPFISIQELSIRLNVGKASIVRLANRLGFNGFAGLKETLKKSLQSQLGPLERFGSDLSHVNINGRSELQFIAQQEVDNINSTLKLFDERMFMQSVSLISKAEDIFTVGMGISSFLANLTAYLLRRIGYRAFSLNESGLKFTEQLVTIDKKDLVIAFSLPPYSKETIDAAIYARKQRAHLIAITNSASAPIVQYSDVYLIAKTESRAFSNSLSPIIMLINTLSCEVAKKDKRRAQRSFQKMLALRTANNTEKK
ncbi:MAG: MurR/RpiR family transcriptional regulator [Stygiobacter sp.]